MTLIFLIFQICAVCLSKAFSEEINMYGDAGEAYSIEVYIGHPHQKLRLLVDTGSTTLAIATYARQDSNEYFHTDNSSSLDNTHISIQAAYTTGTWVGELASDFIRFPSLTGVPEVWSDFALIRESQNFFIKGSEWQGLLGLAYLPVGAWGKSAQVCSWLDAVDRDLNKPMSFYLKLCGPISTKNTTHYGYFNLVDYQTRNPNHNKTFRTPVLHKRWYVVGVIAIRVMKTDNPEQGRNLLEDTVKGVDADMCVKMNMVKSIVDSGTTQIKLPDKMYRQIVDELKNELQKSQVLLDEFWNRGEAACWPQPQVWTLPWLAIDLLSADADNQYFTLEIPPQNYMLEVGVHNSSDTGTVSTYCYKLGLEGGGSETVLGYTAMEGLQVTFNRSAGWIGWQTSDCGANTRITGPYNVTTSLRITCQLIEPIAEVATSIKAAQWALCAISIIAAGVLLYLLAPCVKTFFLRRMHPRSLQISLSQAALVEQESS